MDTDCRMNAAGITVDEVRASNPELRPALKWAGGKTQLIPQLDEVAPGAFGKYIEPFIGGGAYFLHLNPPAAVISDSNAELINMYQAIASTPADVAAVLELKPKDSDSFYAVRRQDWKSLTPAEAAARTIYLNRLCFNGLFRVNRRGEFNVPFGRYKNPLFPGRAALEVLSATLRRTVIVHGDYKSVLATHAAAGDFVFLDPPYIPVGEYSDFKRYTAKQFRDEDHRELAAEVARLVDLGCSVVLTNSNHPLVYELYSRFEIRVVKTRRNINSAGNRRQGEDVIVVANATTAKRK